MVKQMLGKLLKFENPYGQTQQAPVEDVKRIHVTMNREAIGSYGVKSYGGYASEDYLQKMTGKQRADEFDKMRRSDPQVKMCLSAVKSPIKSAMWTVEAGKDSGQQGQEDADLIKFILFEGMEIPFSQFLSEALTYLDFGHSVFEMIDKVFLNHPKYGTINGLRSLAFRSQRTLERWNLDEQTQLLKSVTQYAYGDLQKQVDIPAEFLLVFTLEKEGANYEGISALRPCYGNYFRKNHYLKLNAIGIEKHAIPTPMAEVPDGKENSDQYNNLIDVLEAYQVHEKNFLTFPTGWKITLNNNDYDPQKVETSIDNEDKRMVKAFMANFLELGMNGFGSQSLSFDLSDFFLGAIDHVACGIEDVINQILIPRLIQLNRGPRQVYPKLTHSGITDKAGKELGDIIKAFVDSGVVKADDKLEEHVRERYGLPESDPTTQRALPSSPAPMGAPAPTMSEKQSLLDRVRSARKTRHV